MTLDWRRGPAFRTRQPYWLWKNQPLHDSVLFDEFLGLGASRQSFCLIIRILSENLNEGSRRYDV
jgi:hypothetical protein